MILQPMEKYLSKFHDYYNLSSIPSYQIIGKIQYYFGVDEEVLNKTALWNKQEFIKTILKHSKKSDLEKDLENEIEEMLNLVDYPKVID